MSEKFQVGDKVVCKLRDGKLIQDVIGEIKEIEKNYYDEFIISVRFLESVTYANGASTSSASFKEQDVTKFSTTIYYEPLPPGRGSHPMEDHYTYRKRKYQLK